MPVLSPGIAKHGARYKGSLLIAAEWCVRRAIIVSALMLAGLANPAWSASPLSVGEHNIVINGVRLWYRVAGEQHGIPVVFLHGGPGQGSQTFARFVGPSLEPKHRMVYLDQRGSGRSEKHWNKEYSLDLMVDDLEELRRQLGTETMVLIGHSFGTVLALEYAGKYSGHVSRLVLTGAIADFPGAVAVQCDRLKKNKPELYEKAVSQVAPGSSHLCNPFVAGREYIDEAMYPDPTTRKLVDETDAQDGMTNSGEIFGALAKQGILEWRFDKHERLKMPVLVIGGSRDYQAVVEPLRSFVAKVPGARLVEYPGSGHFMFVEQPMRFARDISAFIGRPSNR